MLVLGGTKQRSVLAILLLNAGVVVSSDRLIDELWGEQTPDDASTALQQHVSRLRKLLEPHSVLITRPPGYVLELDADALDLFRFEQLRLEGHRLLDVGSAESAARILREALSLWRGDALADLENEPFARDAVLHLEEARWEAVEARIEADLALGRHAQLVGELRLLVIQHPLRERFRGQLMLALYRSGRQADALDVYAEARRTLVSELGLEPGAALQRLQQAILEQEQMLDLGAPASAIPLEPSAERVVVALVRDLDGVDALGSVGRVLTSGAGGELIFVHIAAPATLGAATAALSTARDRLADGAGQARVAAFSSSTPGEDVVRLALREDADTIIADVGEDPLDAEVVAVLTGAPCDVVLVVRAGGAMRPGPVLVPFGAAEHDWAALELGAWLARTTAQPLRLIGSEGEHESGRDASRLLADVSLVLQRATGVVAEPLLVPAGETGIAAVAATAGVLIVGLPEGWRESGLGRVRRTLCSAPPCPLLLALRGVRAGALSPSAPLSRYPWSELRVADRP